MKSEGLELFDACVDEVFVVDDELGQLDWVPVRVVLPQRSLRKEINLLLFL